MCVHHCVDVLGHIGVYFTQVRESLGRLGQLQDTVSVGRISRAENLVIRKSL